MEIFVVSVTHTHTRWEKTVSLPDCTYTHIYYLYLSYIIYTRLQTNSLKCTNIRDVVRVGRLIAIRFGSSQTPNKSSPCDLFA